MLMPHVIVALVCLAVAAGGCGPVAAPSASTRPSPSTRPSLDPLRVTRSGWSTDFTVSSVHLGDFQAGGPPRDGIPTIDQPHFESMAAARSWLAPGSPVIALEVDGMARAYPLAILIWHEIVNDMIGGVPVVVTFCPLCHAGLAFERTLDGTVHEFGVTGNLRFLDLVMYDRQTESWWQQATGEAIVGELTGSKLVFLPTQIVSIADFGAAYPGGEVLSRDTGVERPYGQNPYPGYDRANYRGFKYANEVDGRLAAKERVVTLDLDGEPLAIPYAELEVEGVIEVGSGPTLVIVVWRPGATSALEIDQIDRGRDVGATGVFVPVVDGRRLTFRPANDGDAAMTDMETGSMWSITGRAFTGPLAGTQLAPVLHGDFFWFAWASFEPDTRIWGQAGASATP